MKNNHSTIFTDGSSRGNPGPGGWACVVVKEEGGGKVERGDGKTRGVVELGGHEKMTTNNRMELSAALNGIMNIEVGSTVTVFTDSSYVINGITKWIHGWKRNGWITKTKDEVLNRDLWEKIDAAAAGKKITWKYVGGHVGIVGNERCDHIATDFADGNKVDLYSGLLANYDLPNIMDISFDESKMAEKKSDSSRSRAKAYSYVSSVGGVIETHHTWAECEKRVKGAKGAKYRKSLSLGDEAEIIKEFGTL
ncbi:MAG: viroplasmin family protein [Candidatus Taylorbacteria bacterium]